MFYGDADLQLVYPVLLGAVGILFVLTRLAWLARMAQATAAQPVPTRRGAQKQPALFPMMSTRKFEGIVGSLESEKKLLLQRERKLSKDRAASKERQSEESGSKEVGSKL